jgi:hypothetical protein
MASWDELTRSKKLQLAGELAGGNKSAENVNRAMEILANNPDVLRKVAQELGIEDEIDAAESRDSIEDNVDRLLKKRIPSPKKDESFRDYVTRLQEDLDKQDRGQSNESYEDEIFGQSKEIEGEV